VRRMLSIVALIVVPPLANITAQEPANIEPGSRVRVTAPTIGLSKYTGTFMAANNDTLVVDTLSISMRALTGLDVHRGVMSNVGRGALIGGSIGGGLGMALLIIGAAIDCFGCAEADAGYWIWGTVAVTALLAAPGAGIGALIGRLSTHDNWEETPLNHLHVSFAPRRDGFAVGLSVAF